MEELRREPVDRAELARELADVMYVAYGTAYVHRIDLDVRLTRSTERRWTRCAPASDALTARS